MFDFAIFCHIGQNFSLANFDLKPVFERLNGVVDYEQLKILRLVALCDSQAD